MEHDNEHIITGCDPGTSLFGTIDPTCIDSKINNGEEKPAYKPEKYNARLMDLLNRMASPPNAKILHVGNAKCDYTSDMLRNKYEFNEVLEDSDNRKKYDVVIIETAFSFMCLNTIENTLNTCKTKLRSGGRIFARIHLANNALEAYMDDIDPAVEPVKHSGSVLSNMCKGLNLKFYPCVYQNWCEIS